jgi:GNAT superfamily N-acetyltransferase
VSWFLHRWFNIAPYKGAEYIKRRNGEKFWILWRGQNEDVAKFRVYYYRKPVGHVNVIEEDNKTLCLADIFVKEEFQRLGLGKQMMHLLVERARQMGYQEICGTIQPSQGNTLEYLQEWYKRQGFIVNGNKFSMNCSKLK